MEIKELPREDISPTTEVFYDPKIDKINELVRGFNHLNSLMGKDFKIVGGCKLHKVHFDEFIDGRCPKCKPQEPKKCLECRGIGPCKFYEMAANVICTCPCHFPKAGWEEEIRDYLLDNITGKIGADLIIQKFKDLLASQRQAVKEELREGIKKIELTHSSHITGEMVANLLRQFIEEVLKLLK